MDKEKIEINYEELNNQQREEILKSGNYVKIEILVPEVKNDEFEMPLILADIHGANVKTIAECIVGLKTVINEIEEKYPIANLISKLISTEYSTLDLNNKKMSKKKKFEND